MQMREDLRLLLQSKFKMSYQKTRSEMIAQSSNEILTGYLGSWDSIEGVATGCGLDDQGMRVRTPVGAIILSSPRRPNRL
jgi:hypothetical protein